jgi:hypothetical protein
MSTTTRGAMIVAMVFTALCCESHARTLDTIRPALDLLFEINAIRRTLHLSPLGWDARLVAASTAHARYVAQRYERRSLSIDDSLDHEERWLDAGFTGHSPRDRLERFGAPFERNWELIAPFGSPSKALDAWIESLYHRVPLVHPNAVAIGYGRSIDRALHVDVAEVTGDASSDIVDPVRYPPDRARGVRRMWAGAELPQPQLPASGYPSGPVITLTFPFGAEIDEGTFLLGDAHGALVDAHRLHPGNDPHLTTTYALIPLAPLACMTWHHVMFRGRVNGTVKVYEWDFETGP